MALLRSFHAGYKNLLRPQFYCVPYQHLRCVTMQAAPFQPPKKLSHDEKNALRKRPMSPHLTIYKPQLTSLMSLSHRTTGIILAGYAVILAGASFCPLDVPHMVSAIEELHLPSALIYSSKFVLALPATYHLFNGIRHLAWDLGKGLTLKEVYTSGYITLAFSFILAAFLTFI